MGNGERLNFCYRIEYELGAIGSIHGPSCKKFGVWWSRTKKKYDYDDKFGANLNEAFARIKDLIIQLIVDGKKEDYKAMADNPLHPLVKGKILSVYYPNKYLNVFSNNHVDSYLDFFGLNTKQLRKQDLVYKRKVLVDFKNQDNEMKHWSIDLFAVFLWSYYPTDSHGRELSLLKRGKF